MKDWAEWSVTGMRKRLAALEEENIRLQGRLAATQDHHDAEHEKCARNAIEEDTC